MTDAARQRLASQRLVGPTRLAEEVVAWMGAVQAQDRPASLWAIGQRMARPSREAIERAVEARRIVRTWPMRGTLHFVAARDVHGMLALLAPRASARAAGRRRELGIGEAELERSRRALVRALQGGQRLTRPQARDVLERAGIATCDARGLHILGHLAHEGLLCLGPMDGKQATWVLLDEWVPRPARLPPREEALATLAARYLRSHAPASAKDFAWWTGLGIAEARSAVEAAGAPKLRRVGQSGAARLLPAFDEFLVGYQDRAPSLARLPPARAPPSAGLLLSPTMTLDGQVVGFWGRARSGKGWRVALRPVVPLGAGERDAFEAQVNRFGAFWGVPAHAKWQTQGKL
jgi:hypothetical protein